MVHYALVCFQQVQRCMGFLTPICIDLPAVAAMFTSYFARSSVILNDILLGQSGRALYMPTTLPSTPQNKHFLAILSGIKTMAAFVQAACDDASVFFQS